MTWHLWGLVTLWSVAILIMFLADCWHLGQTMKEIALIEARAYLNKDKALRLWAASHGGVYVPVSDKTPPNPYLRNVPERDIGTPNGRVLTLMNPAYMIRQVMSDFEQTYQVQGHITSLRYFRKETAPDAWEKTALTAFGKGTREVRDFTDIHGKPVLRIMRPLETKAPCLKCHAAQGYKIGDIRGGVSLALPMSPYLTFERKEIATHGLSFAVIWILGGAGFWLAASKLSRFMKRHDAVEEELKTTHSQMKHFMADMVRHQENERKAIALEIHEEIAQSLSAIKMSLEAGLDTNTPPPGPESQAMLSIIERIKVDIELIRRLTKKLSPIMLDNLGIKTAVETLCSEITKSGGLSEIRTHVDIDDAVLPGELKIAIYRVLENMLRLATGHCKEGCWTVDLSEFDGDIILSVRTPVPDAVFDEDNSAWNSETAEIRNRAALFGGSMAITSGEENNGEITVHWSLQNEARE
jgi:hypothetical protein